MKIFFCGGQFVSLEPASLSHQPGYVFLSPGNTFSGHIDPSVKEYLPAEKNPAYAHGVYDRQKDYSRGHIFYQFYHGVIFPGYHIQHELNGGIDDLGHENKHNGNTQRRQFITVQSEEYASEERRNSHQENQAHILMIPEQIEYPRTGIPETLNKTPVPEYMPENPETSPPFNHLAQLPEFIEALLYTTSRR
jgi:hypothetical protein